MLLRVVASTTLLRSAVRAHAPPLCAYAYAGSVGLGTLGREGERGGGPVGGSSGTIDGYSSGVGAHYKYIHASPRPQQPSEPQRNGAGTHPTPELRPPPDGVEWRTGAHCRPVVHAGGLTSVRLWGTCRRR